MAISMEDKKSKGCGSSFGTSSSFVDNARGEATRISES
jgi:hypothetical protein